MEDENEATNTPNFDEMRRLQCLQMALDMNTAGASYGRGEATAESVIAAAASFDGFVRGEVSLSATEADHG